MGVSTQLSTTIICKDVNYFNTTSVPRRSSAIESLLKTILVLSILKVSSQRVAQVSLEDSKKLLSDYAYRLLLPVPFANRFKY